MPRKHSKKTITIEVGILDHTDGRMKRRELTLKEDWQSEDVEKALDYEGFSIKNIDWMELR